MWENQLRAGPLAAGVWAGNDTAAREGSCGGRGSVVFGRTYSSRRVGSQPTRSALAFSFSRARFWIWRTRSLLMRSR